MSNKLRQRWSQEEFLAWAGTQEERFEFDGFAPRAMTGGSIDHNIICHNIIDALRGQLREGCRPLGPDVGLATIGSNIRYPDVMVSCGKLDGKALTASGVVVVFEVLSASTSSADRIIKLREYAAVPSIRRYVIVESTSVGLTVLERETAGEAWRATALTGDGTLSMPELNFEFPVAELYQGVEFASKDAG